MNIYDATTWAIQPGARELVRAFEHGTRVLENALAMKGRLDKTALLGVQRFFGGEQPIAQHGARPLHERSAVMACGIGDEKIADEVGVIELVGMPRAQAKMDEITVNSRIFLQEA
jgi:hypothetical protein